MTEEIKVATPFWGDEAAIEALGEPPTPVGVSVLELLGPSPFPKNKFPFLGFLASVYDHVASCVGGDKSSLLEQSA